VDLDDQPLHHVHRELARDQLPDALLHRDLGREVHRAARRATATATAAAAAAAAPAPFTLHGNSRRR